MDRKLTNPILSGFYPDPSICRAGEDYYLINSTFEYFPGLPVFHSRDLVNWRQIGHVLDRPSQLPLDGIRPSGGLYAPTIRYHNDTFYVINTLVSGLDKSGNFIVKATKPEGPWSEPYWIEGAQGIDPSLLFDDDGKAWYVGQRDVANSRFWGNTEIWIQQLDIDKMCLIGDKYPVWGGAVNNAPWVEGPHLYKINGMYYLVSSEGGTGHDHAVTVARSKCVTGPYEGYPRNPVLTHRHLGWDYPITSTGHADLVETQNGEWWMVLLATRPYGGYYYNLGRETYLAPIKWEDGWPTVSPGSGRVEWEYPAPNLPEHRFYSEPVCDHFEKSSLSLCWNFLRTPREEFWSLSKRPGFLQLKLRPQMLSELATPSFVGRRQQHINFAVRAEMEFTPQGPNECAGLVLLQNNDFHFRFVLTQQGSLTKIVVIQRREGKETSVAERPLESSRVYFKVEAIGQDYNFFIATESEQWLPVAEHVDGRILSTNIAGGFVGAYVGLYASSNGKTSNNVAEFDWFEYTGR